jgi:Holliday junction resolvase
MNSPDWSTERRDIERVAQEYRERGYHVSIEPAVSDLPDFVREYRPDIVARKGEESVVIEVKLPRSESDRERIRAIAERVQRQPGWRFVLVAPKPSGSVAPGESLRLMKPQEIEKLLKEVDELRLSNHSEAALLLAWAALEGAMRIAAEQRSLNAKHPDSWTLMRELVSNGLLDRERYEEFMDLYGFRSAVAHGLEPTRSGFKVAVDRATETLAQSARSLLAEGRASQR